MGCLIDQLADEFSKGELIMVAEAFGLSPTSDWGARRIAEVVLERIRKDGLKDKAQQPRAKELVDDFLYIAFGDQIPEGPSEKKSRGAGKPADVKPEPVATTETNPDCYSYADDQDPACKKCKLYSGCAQERIANLPPCFGKKYDPKDQECRECFEGIFCRQGVENAS